MGKVGQGLTGRHTQTHGPDSSRFGLVVGERSRASLLGSKGVLGIPPINRGEWEVVQGVNKKG